MTNAKTKEKSKSDYYRRLKWNIVAFTIIVVCIPLPFVAGTIYKYYWTYVHSSVMNNLKSIAKNRDEAIQVFLTERLSYLKTLSQLMNPENIGDQKTLDHLFSIVKKEAPSFVDMGIINDRGVQIAYVGPYDLLAKNYRDSIWFKEVSEKGVYISDVFLGFRNVPHLALAVKGTHTDSVWFLRATIDTDTFQRLLRSGHMGLERDAYIINRDKEVQIHTGNSGSFDPASVSFPAEGEILVNKSIGLSGYKTWSAATWLNNNRWLLIVEEDPESEFISLSKTTRLALSLLVTALVIIGLLSYYAAHWIVKKIQKADHEKELLNEQLMQTSKLASLGRMAAGVAHEINNPLAIISESAGYAQELMEGLGSENRDLTAEQRQEIYTALKDIRAETFRGKDVTQRLLGFARKMESKLEDVDINHLLADVLKFYHRPAKVKNVTILEQFDNNVGSVRTDPSQIQQVIFNLIDNALYFLSHDKTGGEIVVRTEKRDRNILIIVGDNGPGIKPEVKEKIFDPFFTTKPVGQGTGLGLAICYGIINKLGGEITVDTKEGKGTSFLIRLPITKPEGGDGK